MLLICNYEKRELTVAYFMKETGDEELKLLYEIGGAMRKAGIKVNLRCEGKCWAFEEKCIRQWHFTKVMCACSKDDEPSIAYKRMLAVLYEMGCRKQSPDVVASMMA